MEKPGCYALSCSLSRRPALAAWDLAAGFLFALHSQGIDEGEEAPPQGEAALRVANEVVLAAHRAPLRFVAYFDNAADAWRAQQAIGPVLAGFGPDFQIHEVKEKDHSRLWKAQFRPVEVKPFWLVRAPWHKPAADPRKVEIVIDPGMAFGTGSHESTRACLGLIAAALKGRSASQLEESCVLDFGCGSGILAMALKKLGVGRSLAVDIDPLAIEATLANASLNSVPVEAGPTLPALPLLDGIVANILKKTLIEHASQFYSWLKPGGFLILSGLLSEQERAVEERFTEIGFRINSRICENNWVSLMLIKDSERTHHVIAQCNKKQDAAHSHGI